jgi:transaldolase
MTPAGRLQQLSAHGVAVWWDSISRERLADSGLAALAQDSKVVGVTSNPQSSTRRCRHETPMTNR